MSGLSSLVLVLSSVTFAGSVPLDVQLLAEPAPVPAQVSLFAPVPGAQATTMADLQDAFGLTGIPAEVDTQDLHGGLEHLETDGFHLWSFADGSGEMHDLVGLKTEAIVEPLPPGAVLTAADELLGDLGLFDVPGVDLQPARVGAHTLTRRGPNGELIEQGVVLQTAHYQQSFEGLPGVGGGAVVDLIVAPQDHAVVALNHAVRPVQAVGVVDVMPLEQAVEMLGERARFEGRFNLVKAGVAQPERAIIESAELAVFVPDASQGAETYEPVWVLSGVVEGTDAEGVPASVDLLWMEPAGQGRDLPALEVNPLR